MKHFPKDLDVGFIILCPDGNINNLKHTIKSIRLWYSGSSYISVVGSDVNKHDIDELKESCPTHRGKKTITSLINTGMRNAKNGWNLIVIAGSWLQGGELNKFSIFAHDEKNILFPITRHEKDGKYSWIGDWEKGTINGIMMHKNTFKLIGPFADNQPLLHCKVMWALSACEKGCKFKSILGPKIT